MIEKSNNTCEQKIKLSLKPSDEYNKTDGRIINIAKITRFLCKGIKGFKKIYIKKIYNLFISPIDANVAIEGIGINEYIIAGSPLLNE